MSDSNTKYSPDNPDAFIKYVMNLLKKYGICQQFEGFTDEEIERIKEAQQADDMPKIFEAYLKHMGHIGFNHMFVGSDFGFDSMMHDKEIMVSNIEYLNAIYEKQLYYPSLFLYLYHIKDIHIYSSNMLIVRMIRLFTITLNLISL